MKKRCVQCASAFEARGAAKVCSARCRQERRNTAARRHNRAWYQANRDYALFKSLIRRLSSPEAARAHARASYSRHAAKRRKQAEMYRKLCAVHVRLMRRRYYRENRKKLSRRSQEWNRLHATLMNLRRTMRRKIAGR